MPSLLSSLSMRQREKKSNQVSVQGNQAERNADVRRSTQASSAAGKPVIRWQHLVSDADEISRCLEGRAVHTSELRSALWESARLDADFGENEVAIAQHRQELDAQLAGWQHWERIFQEIRQAKLTGAPMPKLDFDGLASKMNQAYGYPTPRSAFEPRVYGTFEDWFLRRLAPSTRVSCLQKAAQAAVCAPVQAVASSQVLDGLVTLKVSVVVVADLLGMIGSGAEDKLVQFALRKTDYHHVHSPVDGIIESSTAFCKDQLFPGSEAMTILTISAAFGQVKVLCIGEWSVQSFVPEVKVGDRVAKLDELGHFDFGSRVIISVPSCVSLHVRAGQRVFPGDPVGQLKQI